MKGLNSALRKINYLRTEGVFLSLNNAGPTEQKAMLVTDLTGNRFHQKHKSDDSKANKCKSGSHRCPASIDRCGSSAFLKVSPE